MKKLIKFSQPTCIPCKILSNYLENQGVKYEDVDVFDDVYTASKYGIMGGLPVLLLLEDEEVIGRSSGFNPSFTQPVDDLVNQLD